MKYLILIMTCLFFISCAKEDEGSLSNNSRSCTGVVDSVNICINYDNAGLSAAEKDAFCKSVTSGALSDDDCSTTNSNGVCSGVSFTYAGQQVANLNLRYYLGSAIQEQGACSQQPGTWTADSGGLVYKSKSSLFCESNNSCIKLKSMSRENAQKFCDQMNGYLDNNCE